MRTAVTLLLALAILGGEAPAQQLVGPKESVFTLSERLADSGTVRIYSPLGDITITEASGNWRDRARVNITVSIPRGTRVRSGTGNGALSVNGAFADARVGSGNGRVRVTGGVVP